MDRLTNTSSELRSIISRETASWLLYHPYEWRERRVDAIQPLDDRRYRQRTSLQFVIWPQQLVGVLARLRRNLRRAPAVLKELNRTFPPDKTSFREGDEIQLLFPLATLPKNLLLTPDLEDATGARLPLLTRYENSLLTTYHISKGLMLSLGRDLTEGELNIIRALVFCIPSGIFEDANFATPALSVEEIAPTRGGERDQGALERGASAVVDYVSRPLEPWIRRPMAELLEAERVQELLVNGWDLFPAMFRHAWVAINGLRDPILNPLLLLPDHIKTLRKDLRDAARDRGTEEPKIDVETAVLNFLEACEDFVTKLLPGLIDQARQDSEQGDNARVSLFDLSRFTHSWVAFVPASVVLGRRELFKFRQTAPLEQPTEGLRRLRVIIPAVGMAQLYTPPVGDAEATHVEVSSPDPAAVRIATRRTSVGFGSTRDKQHANPRVLFGLGYTKSRELQTFYTTKTQDEVSAVVRSVASDEEAAEWQTPAKKADVPTLRIVYKLQPGVSLFLYVLAAFAMGAAVTLLAFVISRESLGQTALGLAGALLALIAFVTGFLAIRERVHVTAWLLTPARAILLLALLILIAAFGRLLFVLANQPIDLRRPIAAQLDPSERSERSLAQAHVGPSISLWRRR